MDTKKIQEAIQEGLPKMVADEPLERIEKINELEEDNEDLKGHIDDLEKTDSRRLKELDKIAIRESAVKVKEEALDKRESEVQKLELANLKLSEAEKRTDLAVDLFNVAFSNSVIKENISKSYIADNGNYQTDNISKTITKE